MGLRSQVIIAVVVTCSIVNSFLCFYFIERIRYQEILDLEAAIHRAVDLLEYPNAKALATGDYSSLNSNLKGLFENFNLQRISMVSQDSKNNIVFGGRAVSQNQDVSMDFPIHFNGNVLGTIELVYTTQTLDKNLARFKYQIFLATFGAMVLLGIALALVINHLFRPLRQLAIAASCIAGGDLNQRIPHGGQGEVGVLVRNFARMRDAMKEKITALGESNNALEVQLEQMAVNEEQLLRQSQIISSVNSFLRESMLLKGEAEILDLYLPMVNSIIPLVSCLVGRMDSPDTLRSMAYIVDEEGMCMGRPVENGQVNFSEISVLDREYFYLQRERACQYPEDGFRGLDELDSVLVISLPMGSQGAGLVMFQGDENGFADHGIEAVRMLTLALGEALTLKSQESEKQRLEELVIQSEKMASLGGLAAGLAHEINNPLAGILQNAQVIKNRLQNLSLPANVSAARATGLDLAVLSRYLEKRQVVHMIDSVLTAGHRAADIVANMLSFSRKSASGFIPEDICRLMDKTLELAGSYYNFKENLDFKKISIIRDYEPNLPLIPCRASEIQQVFFNILSNGAQVMGQWDGKTPVFELRIFSQDRYVVVEIGDNGPGMPMEVQRRIFEPFFTTKGVGEGTGLGLAVSYFIVTESHNGQIRVASSPGQGSRFSIFLPQGKM